MARAQQNRRGYRYRTETYSLHSVFRFELDNHPHLLMHLVAPLFPLGLVRCPLEVKEPQYLRDQLSHLHDRDGFPDASAYAVTELNAMHKVSQSEIACKNPRRQW